MFEVFDFNIYQQLKITNRSVDDIQVGNIAVVAGDQVRKLAQRPGFVIEHDFQAADMRTVVGVVSPGNIQPAFRFISIFFQSFTVNGMNGNPLAGSNNTDNAIARQRVTAAGKMNRHSRNKPFDFQRFALLVFFNNLFETRHFNRLDHFFKLRLLISRINRL